MWVQGEFDFSTRKIVDYNYLYSLLLKGPLTFAEIMAITGIKKEGVSQVITTLSLHYPIWEVKRGVYKLLTEEDFKNYR